MIFKLNDVTLLIIVNALLFVAEQKTRRELTLLTSAYLSHLPLFLSPVCVPLRGEERNAGSFSEQQMVIAPAI